MRRKIKVEELRAVLCGILQIHPGQLPNPPRMLSSSRPSKNPPTLETASGAAWVRVMCQGWRRGGRGWARGSRKDRQLESTIRGSLRWGDLSWVRIVRLRGWRQGRRVGIWNFRKNWWRIRIRVSSIGSRRVCWSRLRLTGRLDEVRTRIASFRLIPLTRLFSLLWTTIKMAHSAEGVRILTIACFWDSKTRVGTWILPRHTTNQICWHLALETQQIS